MKKQDFQRVGVSEREAGFQLVWTIGWAVVMLAVTIVSVFQP